LEEPRDRAMFRVPTGRSATPVCHFGFLSAMVSIDNPTSSALTQELLGWKPEGFGPIADIEEGHCFNS
jgi:hypothetical protein